MLIPTTQQDVFAFFARRSTVTLSIDSRHCGEADDVFTLRLEDEILVFDWFQHITWDMIESLDQKNHMRASSQTPEPWSTTNPMVRSPTVWAHRLGG